MQLDQAYQILAKVGLDADLRIKSPSGGLIQVKSAPDADRLLVRCSEEDSLRDLWRLCQTIGTPSLSLSNLRHLRSPLLQTVVVSIGERELLSWAPGHLPRLRSLRLLMRLLG